MNNLHELTKQLDVLTWNSRSVLNALIRSAMAAGSSDGFTVKRAGEPVTLSQQDIYKLYHFYEAWEATQFDENAFEEIRTKMNEEYSGTDGVDAALVKHAKIMWMDADNATSTADQWIEKIKQYTNPKWLTNTAPIPLNIRTPIYDENLSTKVYDSYETYLFPSAYYAIDTLGHSGDGFDHSAGGTTWHFIIDDVFQVDANRVLLGTQDANRLAVYSNLYGTAPLHSLEGGTDSFAFSKNSISFGQRDMVNGDNSAILGGFSNVATGSQTAVLGGNSNIVNSTNSAIGGGLDNMIGAGAEGFAANSRNNIGGYTYFFRRTLSSENNTQTACKEIEKIGNCGEYQRIDPTTATTTSGGIALAANQIYIPEYGTSGIGFNRISAGSMSAKVSPVDFKVGDNVTLFGFRTNDGFGIRPCPAITTAVVSIQVWTNAGLFDVDKETFTGNIYGYVITLSSNINSTTIKGLGDYSIQSGYVVRLMASNYPNLTEYNTVYSNDPLYTDNCSAFGYNNIACGDAQFVVGSSNQELVTPRFIVGSGSSYIDASNYHRENSLVSAPHYTYMKTSHYIVSGVATMTTAKVHGDGDWYLTTRIYDEDYRTGVEKYAGFFAYSKNHKGNSDVEEMTRAVLRVFHEKSLLAIGDNGLILREPFIDTTVTPTTTGTVWNELYCKEGAIAIHSGSGLDDGTQTVDNNWEWFYNDWVRSSSSPGSDQSVTIWSAEKTGIHGFDLQLHASTSSGYIYMNSYALKIRGITRDALTAQPTDYGIEEFSLTDKRADLITDSGHFYCAKARSSLSITDPDIGYAVANTKYDDFHIMSSSRFVGKDGNYNVYDVAQIVLPGGVSCTRADRGTDNMPHPIVMSYAVRKNTGRGAQNDVENSRDLGNGYIYEELAYRSDIAKQAGTLICNNIGVPAYTIQPSTTIAYYKVDSEPLVNGMSKVATYDNILSSMNLQDAYFHKTHDNVGVTSVAASENGKIIRPTVLASYAGEISDCSANTAGTYWSYYLDGVQINPSMYMELYDDTNHTRGIAYLAYGHAGLQSSALTPLDTIKDIYHGNLSGGHNRSLYTSKYSKGTTDANVTDLRDVWVSIITNDDTSDTMRWQLLMQNLIMTVAGGRLTVEFDLNLAVMKKYYAIPVKQAGSSNEIAVYDNAPGNMMHTLNELSQSIVLPVDPSISNSMQSCYNASTNVSCMLHGRAYYTGDVNISITGYFGKATPGHAFNRTGNWVQTYAFNTPCVVLNMAKWSGWAEGPADQWYHCMVEGVINYVG